MHKISDKVTLIDTMALGVRGVVSAYLVKGKELALLDMGYSSSVKTILRGLADEGVQNLDYLVPTHVHLDHCGSCGTLARHFQSASIYVHPRGAPHLSDPSGLVKGATEIFGDELMNEYGLPEPISPRRIKMVADGDIIDLGGGIRIRAVWTPGHAPHHISWMLESDRFLFTGDAVGMYWPDVPVLTPATPPPSFNLKETIESLNRVSALSPARLLTPHFGTIERPQEWIAFNIQTLKEHEEIFRQYLEMHLSEIEMIHNLLSKIADKAGLSLDQIPSHVQISVKTTVLGFTRYMRWITGSGN